MIFRAASSGFMKSVPPPSQYSAMSITLLIMFFSFFRQVDCVGAVPDQAAGDVLVLVLQAGPVSPLVHLLLEGFVLFCAFQPEARDHGQAELCQRDKDVGRDHAQLGIFLERLVVVYPASPYSVVVPDWVLGVRPSTTPAPASVMFNRRWTSASVTDSEDLCLSSPGMWFHFQVDVLVFLGFKGGLGHKEGRDVSPSVVIAPRARSHAGMNKSNLHVLSVNCNVHG